MGGIPVPAPAPSVNAWEKPITLSNGSAAQTVAISNSGSVEGVKYDKGYQHDSSIDISEPQNSAASSTRSSPSAESKTNVDFLAEV